MTSPIEESDMHWRPRKVSLSMSLALVISAVIGASSVSAQSAMAVRNVDGSLAAPWSNREACVGLPKVCRSLLVNNVTNEIAAWGDTPRPGFSATGQGKEIVRQALSAAAATPTAARTDISVMSSAGVILSPWKMMTCVGGDGLCPMTIVNTRTHEIAMYDGKLSPAFRATGAGKEIIRKPLASQ